MRCHVLLISVVAYLLPAWPILGNTDAVGYGFSRNGDYCVRVSVGSSLDQKAQIRLFKYDRMARQFVFVHSAHLPYWNKPLRVLVSCDGRFVVALGKYGGAGDDLRDGIWIWDAQRGLAKSIHLDSLFSADDLDRYASRFHMLPGIYWFADDADGLPPVFDLRRNVLYVTMSANSFALGTGHSVRSRKRYTMRRPTVVVDLASMTARMVDTRRVSLWKERHDHAVMEGRLLEALLDSYVSDSSYRHIRRLVKQSIRLPSVEMRAVGEHWLFRLEPGNGQTHASIIALRYTASRNSFISIRELPTPNPIAPCDWRVSHDGRYVVTLDDINGIGTTQNTIVIYRVRDGRRRRYALKDLLSQSEVARLKVSRDLVAWRSVIWNMDIVKDGGRIIEINRYGPSCLPKVLVSLDRMTVAVRSVEIKEDEVSR